MLHDERPANVIKQTTLLEGVDIGHSFIRLVHENRKCKYEGMNIFFQ